jgi:outer membrane lipoprotein-sorting protein
VTCNPASNTSLPRLIALLLLACGSFAAGPAKKPTTLPADPALSARLAEIDARAAKVKSLAADFEQQKFTALLRKPLVSSGRVRVKGAIMRWETREPEASVLFIDPNEARIYYPSQKTVEVYPLDKRLGELAASPLPRLENLRARFSLAQIPVNEMDKAVAAKQFMALRLTPIDQSLRQYVREVRVLLNVSGGYVAKAEVTDGDGDRTALSFQNVRLNADVGDLTLSVPPGTTVTHPLEGLDGHDPSSQAPSK